MTSRERIAKAISFQEADRVPIDLGGLKASGISVETYCRMTRQNEAARAADAGACVLRRIGSNS